MSFSLKPKDEYIRDLIVSEYTGNGEDRIRNRDAFTEMLGDLFFTIPALKSVNAHRGMLSFSWFKVSAYQLRIEIFFTADRCGRSCVSVRVPAPSLLPEEEQA